MILIGSSYKMRAGKLYYFDSFGVETPPLFLKDYVDLGSNERMQEYDESYCGVYCLYMIYLIDNGYRIKGALNTLVNQGKCPGGFNKCFDCKPKGKLGVEVVVNVNFNDNVNVNDNVNDNVNVNEKVNDNVKGFQPQIMADDNIIDNVNDKGKANDNVNDNVNDNINDNVNDNINDNVNVKVNGKQESPLSVESDADADGVNDNDDNDDNEDDDKYISMFSEIKQRDKPCPQY